MRISQLDLAGPLSGSEYIALVQEGKTKKAQASSFTPLFTGSCQCTLVSRVNSVAAPDSVLIEYLQTYQMPPNTLRAVGDWIEIISFGTFGINTNAKGIFHELSTPSNQVYNDFTSSGAIDEDTWQINTIATKISATQLKIITTFNINGAASKSDIDYSQSGFDTTKVISISTGSQGLNAASDVIVEGFIIRLNQIDVNS